MESDQRFYLGIDVGRRQHVSCLLSGEQARQGWEHAPVLHFEADALGIPRLFKQLERLEAKPARTICALESTGGYYSQPIFQLLRQRGYTVLWLKNSAVHELRQTVYGRQSKTDVEDARLIARLLYLREAIGQEYPFHETGPSDLRYRNLRLLVELRWKQVQARRRASNQLMQVLDVLFPELRLVFRKSTTLPTALHLLSRLPRVADVAGATEAELRHILVDEAHSLRHQTAAPLLRELARTTIGVREGAEALELAQDWLVRTLRELDASIADLELRLAEAVQHFPETPVLASFPYMSPVRIATLLAGMGAPVEAFATDRALRKQWGWYVEVDQSGSRARSRLGREGNRATRRELYLMAMQLIAQRSGSNPFGHYYQRLVRGNPYPKAPKVALGHVASKLATVMYVCMKRDEPYNPDVIWRHMGLVKASA